MNRNAFGMKWVLLLAAGAIFALAPACQPNGGDEGDKVHQAVEGKPADHSGHDHAAEGGCPHAKKLAAQDAEGKAEGGCPHAKKEGKAGDCGCGKHEGDKAEGGCPHAKKEGKAGDCGCGKQGDAKTADQAIEEADCGGQAKGSGVEAKALTDNPHAGVPIATHQGPLDEKLGQALAGAETVSVADLMAKPDQYEGKTVRLEGQVTDMCFHRRGWFGIADAEGKKVIRVVTGQAGFQVPEGAIGAAAKAEGTIKVVTLDPKQVSHYKKLHKFVSDEDVKSGGSVRQAIVMATGAEFKR